MYLWQKLTPKQRKELLEHRKDRGRPWHSPPRCLDDSKIHFHRSAACYPHAPLIGATTERINIFTDALLASTDTAAKHLFAWCVLPNHYHLLIETHNLSATKAALGKLHGKTSFEWNGEDHQRSRKCFHRVSDRAIRSDRHFWATTNYIHHNPVGHGYVEKWTEWPWTSAHDYLTTIGRENAERIWAEYPPLDYGQKWDSDVAQPRTRNGKNRRPADGPSK